MDSFRNEKNKKTNKKREERKGEIKQKGSKKEGFKTEEANKSKKEIGQGFKKKHIDYQLRKPEKVKHGHGKRNNKLSFSNDHQTMELDDDSDDDVYTEYETKNEQKNKVKKLSKAPKIVRQFFDQEVTHASVDSDESEITDETDSEEEVEDEDVADVIEDQNGKSF